MYFLRSCYNLLRNQCERGEILRKVFAFLLQFIAKGCEIDERDAKGKVRAYVISIFGKTRLQIQLVIIDKIEQNHDFIFYNS